MLGGDWCLAARGEIEGLRAAGRLHANATHIVRAGERQLLPKAGILEAELLDPVRKTNIVLWIGCCVPTETQATCKFIRRLWRVREQWSSRAVQFIFTYALAQSACSSACCSPPNLKKNGSCSNVLASVTFREPCWPW